MELDVKLLTEQEYRSITASHDLDRMIFDLDSEIKMLSSQADTLDYLVSAASGLLCGMLDILWVGEFSLERGRNLADEKVNGFVQKTAKLLGCKKDDVKDCVNPLEDAAFLFRVSPIYCIIFSGILRYLKTSFYLYPYIKSPAPKKGAGLCRS